MSPCQRPSTSLGTSGFRKVQPPYFERVEGPDLAPLLQTSKSPGGEGTAGARC